VVDFSYFMLLGKPWLKDAKVTHDWGNNVIIVRSSGTIKTISINKKLGAKMRRPQILVYYDLLEWLTYAKENLIFEIKPKLFSIGIIIISNEIISLLNIGVLEIKINGESNPKQGTSNQGATKVAPSTTKSEDFYVRPKISLEDKVYLETYYHHTQDDVQVDETLAKI